jgi:MtrB/PioB family decaheme-associated outer membrane protein
MNTKYDRFAIRASVAAVQCALIAMPFVSVAHAGDDPTVADLVQPVKTLEVGVGNVSDGAFKAHEFDGVKRSGVYAIGNIELRGGGAYDSDDATRWSIVGTNLGLGSRNLAVEYGKQGSFRLNFGYDELLRNRSDSYQTPYLGAGTNNLTLPANWIVPLVLQNSAASPNARGLSAATGLYAAGPYKATNPVTQVALTAAQTTTMNNILAADLPDFNKVQLSTKRAKYNAGFSFNIDSQWDIAASAIHEDKTGVKPMSTVSRQSGGDIATVIPDLIDQTTEQYNLSLNFKDDKSFLTAAYYGSVFRNNVPNMSWQNWAVAGSPGNTMSSAPSNQFNQFKLTGGYDFSKTTKLVGDISYARSTQNDAFQYGSESAGALATSGVNGVTSLNTAGSANALVVTKAFDLKLTSKPIKDLGLTAAYKYDDRDNRTPVNTYAFYDVGDVAGGNSVFNAPLGLAASRLGTGVNIVNNRPYSKKVNQLNLDADYTVKKGEAIKVGYDFQKVDRYCNGSWYDCADAATTKENTLRAEWRMNFDDVQGKIGYARSQRKVDYYNENAFLAVDPMANVVPTGQTYSLYQTMQMFGLNGFGPVTTGGYPAGAASGAWTAAQWASVGVNTTGISAAQLSALNYFFANGNAAAKASYASNNVISEILGMRRFNMADRNRDKLRTSLNWQANDKLSLQGGFDYNKDNYENSLYGLQNSKGWSLNLDAAYAASEDLNLGAFYTYEDQSSRMASDAYGSNAIGTGAGAYVGQAGNTLANSCSAAISTVAAKAQNAKMDPCLQWSLDTRDKVDTVGLTFKKKGMLSGKLDLTGDLTYSRARTDYNVGGGSYVNNPLALAAPAPALAASVASVFYIAASAFPTVTTNTVELHLNGKYTIDKARSVRMGYTYQHMKAVDYAYDSMQYGTLTGVLPTSETAPDYTVHTVAVAYIYSFK